MTEDDAASLSNLLGEAFDDFGMSVATGVKKIGIGFDDFGVVIRSQDWQVDVSNIGKLKAQDDR